MDKDMLMEEFLGGNFIGYFVIGEDVVDEAFVRDLVDKGKDVKVDWYEEQLVVDGIVVEYM